MQSLTLSQRQLEKLLPEIIDLVADPLSPIRQPDDFDRGYRELVALLSDPTHVQRVFYIREGSKVNRSWRVLGKKRMKWLRKFYEEEMKGNGN